MMYRHFITQEKEMVDDTNLYFLIITNKISGATEFQTDVTNLDAKDPQTVVQKKHFVSN